MKWNKAKNIPDKTFKRLIGVRKETLGAMVKAAKEHAPKSKHKIKGKKRGPRSKLNWYDKVLMLLMYYREYRTFAHTATAYDISESQCWKIIVELEQILLKSKLFHLPGRKKLHESDIAWEVVVIDVSEHGIERPKKNKNSIIQGKRKNTV